MLYLRREAVITDTPMLREELLSHPAAAQHDEFPKTKYTFKVVKDLKGYWEDLQFICLNHASRFVALLFIYSQRSLDVPRTFEMFELLIILTTIQRSQRSNDVVLWTSNDNCQLDGDG